MYIVYSMALIALVTAACKCGQKSLFTVRFWLNRETINYIKYNSLGKKDKVAHLYGCHFLNVCLLQMKTEVLKYTVHLHSSNLQSKSPETLFSEAQN